MSEPSQSQEEKRGRRRGGRATAKAARPAAERGKQTARAGTGASGASFEGTLARGGAAASPRRAKASPPAKAKPAAKASAGSKGATPRVTPAAAPKGKPASAGAKPSAPLRRRAAAAPAKEAAAPASARRASPPLSRKAPAEPSGRQARPARVSARGPAPAPATEEERIESSKYLARDIPKRRRRFEEARFLFPQTYEIDRVRLLVKDPEWLFAHWDVSPGAWKALHEELGERAMALSKLTLRLEDPSNGAMSVILLPHGARSWYLRTQGGHRAYRAQLGLTTPSGTFRAIATSNTVVTPRVGPSPERAIGVAVFGAAAAGPGGVVADPGHPLSAARHAARRTGAAASGQAGAGSPAAEAAVELIDATSEEAGPEAGLPERGGASDTFSPRKPRKAERGGASDLYRR